MSGSATAGARPPKVLVFGMDGATWEVLAPLIESGAVPTLARVAREGVTGPLASTVHPHSPTAWASFLTGMNPGRHGIFDFVRRRAGSYEVEAINARHRSGRSVWQILSERGVSCGIMNVPMTYPPEKVLGYFVAGAFTSDSIPRFTYPRAVEEEMKTLLGHPYKASVYVWDYSEEREAVDAAALLKYAEGLVAVEDERVDVSLALVERYHPRFVVHVNTATDRAQHHFWQHQDRSRPEYDPAHPFADAVARTYIAADRGLARLWEAMGEDTTVIVMSDHGGAPMGRAMLINRWLEREGYLARVRPARFSRGGFARSVFLSARRLAQRVLAPRARAKLRGRVPGVWGMKMRYLRPAAIDWSRTRAFSEGTFGNIYLNVRGEEPLGLVDPGAERDALVKEIRGKLEALVDPETGLRPVERTHARDELYHGERVQDGPDLVAVLRRGYQMVGDVTVTAHTGSRRTAQPLFASSLGNRRQFTGIHSPEGILLACGGRVAKGARVEGAHITDIAPTILRTFDVPVPPEMDGRVLAELVTA